MKVEHWSGHPIRFVEKVPGEWWAVATDVAKALGYRDAPRITRMLEADEKDTHKVGTPGGEQEMVVISEAGIYEAVFNSKRPEAKSFKRWVKVLLKQLRETTGIEGFQVFRMLDKEHQKEAMARLRDSLRQPGRPNFIKANVIADKAVSSKYGFPKMLKKGQMSPQMLIDRQPILEDTVDLMTAVDRFGLNVSVSDTIYSKYLQ